MKRRSALCIVIVIAPAPQTERRMGTSFQRNGFWDRSREQALRVPYLFD